jgi:hypothetical protein
MLGKHYGIILVSIPLNVLLQIAKVPDLILLCRVVKLDNEVGNNAGHI